jgi:hypothetical protein
MTWPINGEKYFSKTVKQEMHSLRKKGVPRILWKANWQQALTNQ